MGEVKAAFLAIISGDVQMVGFRAYALRQAYSLGVKGYVRNRPDGGVEVYAEGERSGLGRFLGLLRRGPVGAYVEDVDVKWLEYTGKYKEFGIKYFYVYED